MTRFPQPVRLLPHAGRAILIDAIVAHSATEASAVATITRAHPYFVADHGVPVWVGIEMMAQVIAAHGALGASAGADGAPRRGMLLGTRHYDGRIAWFTDGMALTIHAVQTFGHGGGPAACDCRIENAGRLLAAATIVILEESDP